MDGIHGWGKGLVGQLIIEPLGLDLPRPEDRARRSSPATLVDIHTPTGTAAVAPGCSSRRAELVRELALWTIDDNPVTDSTLNLRAEPFSDRHERRPTASQLFSSYKYGDPFTIAAARLRR